MEDIESFSSKTSHDPKTFFLPSSTQLFLYTIIGLILLVLTNAQAIWGYFNTKPLQREDLDFLFENRAEKLGQFINWLTDLQWLLQTLFWTVAGITVYLLVWIVSNVITNLRNDIVAGEYVHPPSYSNVRYWGSIIASKVFLFISSVILVTYTVVCLKYVLPYLSKLFYTAIFSFELPESLLELAISIIGVSAMLYVLALVSKIFINTWKFIYKGL